jgi:sugar lactone lactonase YvrE
MRRLHASAGQGLPACSFKKANLRGVKNMSSIAARVTLQALLCATVLAVCNPASAWDRGRTETFAVLPEGATGPEGLAVGPDGNVYVTTFGFNSQGGVSGPGKLYVFNSHGRLLRQVGVVGSSANLLGVGFHPSTHALLIIDNGNARVLSVDPATGGASVFMTVTGGAGLNAMTFDRAGNVYVSDSFQGIIWKAGANGGPATPWVTNALLSTSGVPPFGANGLGFNKAGDALFVANTGNDTIVKIPVSNGNPGTPSVFVNSVNGADGLVLDRHDNIWVVANQSDEIVVIDPTGKVIAKLGDFNGLTEGGVARGLLFPATPAFSKDGDDLYVTNLALDLRLFSLPQAVDSQWTAQVKRYSISKISARLPNGDHYAER